MEDQESYICKCEAAKVNRNSFWSQLGHPQTEQSLEAPLEK